MTTKIRHLIKFLIICVQWYILLIFNSANNSIDFHKNILISKLSNLKHISVK